MLRGFVFSVVVHSTVLAAAVLTWPEGRTDCDRLFEKARAEEPGLDNVDLAIRYPECAQELDVPIEIVDIADVTNVSAVVKPRDPPPEEPEEQRLEEQPEDTEDEPDVEEVDEEEVPDETAPEEVTEEAVPDELEASEDLAEDEAADEPKPEEDLIKKTAEEEAQEELDSLLDLFEPTLEDKADQQRKAPPKSTDDIQTPVLKDEQRPRKAIGEKTANTASLQASLRRQIGYCWRSVDDLPEPDRLIVTLRMSLDRDGNIASEAKLVDPARRPIGDRFMGVAIDRAMVAVRKCAPYKLPPDDYDEWKDIKVRIGPID